jgi:hypothetical protein
MTDTLKVAGDLYTKPPLDAIGGARWSWRKISIATTDLVSTQLIALNVLPAGHRLMDAVLEVTDMDGSTSLTISAGILNTYYGEAAATVAVPAAYSSGGATNTGTAPALVSGQSFIVASTIGQGGGRKGPDTAALYPTYSIGVDKVKDRVVAVQFAAAPGSAIAGTLCLGILIDRDQE